MYEKNSHCSWCGCRYPGGTPWPRDCSGCGNRSYRNPLPVVVLLLPVEDGLVVVRRNIEPAKGTLTLPGGYLDLGESWQEGARRELLEETGITIGSDDLTLFDVDNGLDSTLVIFGLARRQPRKVVIPFVNSETQEVALIHCPMELGFPLHTRIVARYFGEEKNRSIYRDIQDGQKKIRSPEHEPVYPS